MPDDSENLMRLRAASWALPADLRVWTLEMLDRAVSRRERRTARDRLLLEAAELVSGSPYRQALELERIQLWLTRRPQSGTVVAGTPEDAVAKALSHWPRVVRFRALKRLIALGSPRS